MFVCMGQIRVFGHPILVGGHVRSESGSILFF